MHLFGCAVYLRALSLVYRADYFKTKYSNIIGYTEAVHVHGFLFVFVNTVHVLQFFFFFFSLCPIIGETEISLRRITLGRTSECYNIV